MNSAEADRELTAKLCCRCFTCLHRCSPGVAFLMLVLSAVCSSAATPFTEATVTRLERVVKYGEVRDGASRARPAAVADVVRARNFLLTETCARAELKYADGSIVRIGQNTVFSFEATTRTLSLERGTLLFFIPHGAGGGRITTPSLAAAITGTAGKVSRDMIAVLDGEVTLIPSGQVVPAGSFARRNADGTVTVAPFDASRAGEGRLMNFGGPIPGWSGLASHRAPAALALDLSSLSQVETLERVNNSPSAVRTFFPEPKVRERKREEPAPPAATPRPRPAATPPPIRPPRPPPPPPDEEFPQDR